MKRIFSKIITGIVTLSLLASLACHANETPEVTSFSDVPPAYWGYQTIMDMTEYGIFKGTSTPVNGVGTFSPEKTMTRAEFITAALRAVYPEVAADIEMDKDQWWRGYYVLALDKKLVKVFELDDGDLSKPMSREEMAMVMVRCVENMGEELEKRVSTSQIADYDTIDSYYKEYVCDCFSYGLLCGVDTKGTFAPAKTLTRAEAATVLCRLIDEDMRVDVEFVEMPVETDDEDDNRWDTYEDEPDYRDDRDDKNNKVEENKKPEKEEDRKPTETEKTEEDKPDLMPWEYPNAKQPEEYTAEEYEALTTIQKQAFAASFESVEDFNKWMNQATGGSSNADVMPWEKDGGKQPKEYTWAEYEALTNTQKEAFFDSFGNAEAFDNWKQRVTGNGGSAETEQMPWEDGGKQPKKYTWAEYEALTPLQKEAFFDSFGSVEAFDNWKQSVTGNGGSVEKEEMPWENGGKQPEDYTWAEYERLTAIQKEAFFDSFDNAADFDRWMNQATGTGESSGTEKMPWENGGKQPEKYTWEEYEALTPLQKEAFFESFDDADDFDRWMNQATGTGGSSGTEKMPWENGGKQPEKYTWEEYEALTPLQKEAFFESLEDMGVLDAWIADNQP